VFAESSDDEQIIERVAALDIGKAEIVCCVRLPAADGERRVQEISTHSTIAFTTDALGRHICSTWGEATGNGGAPFSAVIVPQCG
jgi:transposase